LKDGGGIDAIYAALCRSKRLAKRGYDLEETIAARCRSRGPGMGRLMMKCPTRRPSWRKANGQTANSISMTGHRTTMVGAQPMTGDGKRRHGSPQGTNQPIG
jgi:hypothetical protein